MKSKSPMFPIPTPNDKNYWRSLDQLAQTPEFQTFVEREFPEGATELKGSVTRRSFMHLMGASFALAGLASCRRPEEKILTYNKQPEGLVLGLPKYYASTMVFGGEALGILVESHEGRPTKIEGNPDHPTSLGATHIFAQASILDLYDPDRSQHPVAGTNSDQKLPLEQAALLQKLQELRAKNTAQHGKGLRVLSGALNSPTLRRLRDEFLRTFPQAQWHTWEPITDDNIRLGSRIAFGQDVHTQLHLDKAQIIVSLGADPLGLDTGSVRNARDFAQGRRPTPSQPAMNRLYAVESMWTITGTSADHRLRLKPSEIPTFVWKLAEALARQGVIKKLPLLDKQSSLSEKAQPFIEALVQDIREKRAQNQHVVLIPGQGQPPEIHALAHWINQQLDAIGNVVDYKVALDSGKPLDTESLLSLNKDIQAELVETLLILGSNPFYNAPADVESFQDFSAFTGDKVKNILHLGLYQDETAVRAHLHIPQTHFLEAWGDAQATDGTLSVIQPLIAPLYRSWSDIEFIGFWLRGEKISGYQLVQQTWKTFLPSVSGVIGSHGSTSSSVATQDTKFFESSWHRVLKKGAYSSSAQKWNGSLREDVLVQVARALSKRPVTKDGLELVFSPDYSVYDGRFANNGWLQELPDAITKLVWDNAALFSLKTAEKYKLQNNHIVDIQVGTYRCSPAAYIQVGQADDTVAFPLGYGRLRTGRVGTGAGFNAYALRTTQSLWSVPIDELKNTQKMYEDPRDLRPEDFVQIRGLASTQDHFSMEKREIVKETTPDELQHRKKSHGKGHHPPLLSLWKEPPELHQGQQWGMTIDLSSCIGCGACTIACQAENNIPIVGKSQVRKNREMHWIRVDRYFEGNPDDPHAVHQPVPCMHCEHAPCENVCPVVATVHSADGLNDMVYNRCVGTRYCENNCPYKVRRFNFLDWRGIPPESDRVVGLLEETTKPQDEVKKLKYNPDVTLRSRGVMEKCTYCVQRIRGAQQDAKNHGKAVVEDGKVTPACAQACPTEAIVFGDISDPNSRVSKLKRDARNYDLFGDLNTKPRTSYLARANNPNPLLQESIVPASSKEEHHG